MSGNSFKSDVTIWLQKAFKNQYSNFDIQFQGGSEKGVGYASEIVFFKVIADKTKELHLVLKCCRKELNDESTVQVAFEREIFIFNTWIPILKQFEKEKSLDVLNAFIPHCCYSCMESTNSGVLIFEDLRSTGYKLYPSTEPMNLNHLMMTFSNYGKWHGLNMAYRDQHTEKFNKVCENVDVLILYFMPGVMENVIKQSEINMWKVLENAQKVQMIAKLKKMVPNGLWFEFKRVLSLKEENSIILHGDCWNNNHMFKYKDETDKAQPDQAKFLDFQLAMIGPPIWDLSYNLYSSSSQKELNNFKELLNHYYSSLSGTLKFLGSDPVKLFPVSELIRQWKLYSSFGLILGLVTILLSVSEKADTTDLLGLGNDNFSQMVERTNEKNNEKVSSRTIDVLAHWIKIQEE